MESPKETRKRQTWPADFEGRPIVASAAEDDTTQNTSEKRTYSDEAYAAVDRCMSAARATRLSKSLATDTQIIRRLNLWGPSVHDDEYPDDFQGRVLDQVMLAHGDNPLDNGNAN